MVLFKKFEEGSFRHISGKGISATSVDPWVISDFFQQLSHFILDNIACG